MNRRAKPGASSQLEQDSRPTNSGRPLSLKLTYPIQKGQGMHVTRIFAGAVHSMRTRQVPAGKN